MAQTGAIQDGAERRREPRNQADGDVRIGWKDRDGRFQLHQGRLTDESASGTGLLLREVPPTRTSLQVMKGPQTRWARLRSVHWEVGEVRVGVEYEDQALAFLD